MHAVYQIKLIFSSCIQGYHNLYEMRMAVMREQLLHEQKPGLNVVDRYAMAVKQDSFTNDILQI